MRPVEKWIWLPEKQYPHAQTTRYSWHVRTRTEDNYTVARFSREYRFHKAVDRVFLRFSGDTAFSLFCNGEYIANGPVLPGGDFLSLYSDDPMPQHYAT